MTEAIRVLVVEDSSDDMALIERVFRKTAQAFKLHRVQDLGALEKTLSADWDIVISDYHLPGFTAEDVLATIKLTAPDLPVVVMSGALGEEAAVAMMRAGAKDYITKSNFDRLPLIVRREVTEANDRKLRREIEDRLSVSESMFSIFLRNVTEYAIFLLDTEGVILSWNPGAQLMTGYGEFEAIGKDFKVLFTEEDLAARVPEKELRTANENAVVSDERWLVRQDGSKFWSMGTLNAIRNQKKELTGYAKVIRDVTEKKFREERRANEQAWLEQTLQHLPIPLFFADPGSNCIRFSNVAFQKLAGLSETPEFFPPVGHELLKHDGQIVGFKDLLGDRTDCGAGSSTAELVWVTPQRRIDVLASVHHFPETHEQKPTAITSLVDITRLKQIEIELKRASAAKSEFLANMSHEIRTPLGAILGFTELMRDPDLRQQEKDQFSETIQRNGVLLSQLINDILDLAKVESGQIQVERIPVSLSEAINDVAALMMPLALKKKIDLRLPEIDPSIPEMVITDPTRLKQVLLNVIGNAIKFTERGFVQVYLQTAPMSSSNAVTIAFDVCDTGIGIPPEKRDSLFRPFTQADASMTRRFGGTGLGLILSQKIAQVLGGNLTLVDSREGYGSTFRATFEVYPAGSSDARSFTHAINHVAVVESSEILRGKKILVVEDSPDNKTLLAVYLKDQGTDLIFLENGFQALEMLRADQFDAVILDIEIPGLNGHEVIQTARTEGLTIPAMILTAHALGEERLKAKIAGADAFMTKPVGKEKLLHELRSLFRKHKTRSQ